MQKQETKRIFERSLSEFLIEMEKAFEEGFRLSTKREHSISHWIGNYEITLVKVLPDIIKEDIPEVKTLEDTQSDLTPKVAKGRKPTNKN